MKLEVRSVIPFTMVVFVSLAIAGCGGYKPLPLESQFAKIQVGQSDSTQVLNLLGEEGLMQTEASVSKTNLTKANSELGIVRFGQNDSLASQRSYVQVRSEAQMPLMYKESLLISLQLRVPEAVLNEPYENDMQKSLAILKHGQAAMIDSSKPYLEDQQTQSLIGVARMSLNQGIYQLETHPRTASHLSRKEGLTYEHPEFGETHLFLRQDNGDIFNITITSRNNVGLVDTWK